MNMKPKPVIITAVISGIASVMIASSISVVPVGSTGIVLNFGRVSSQTMAEGLHFKVPFVTQVVSMDNRVQKLEVETAATSRDLQAVSSTIAVNFHLAPDSSDTVYQQIGKDYSETMLSPAIQESVKNVMAQYSAEELITHRSTVSASIRDALSQRMNEYGIFINEFNITNFQFSSEFDAAIEAKQVAEQNKIKAQTEKEQRIIEAEAAAKEKTVAAQAEAEAIRVKAQADAEAIKLKANAEAEANAKLNGSLTERVLNYNAIDKWNGEYPQVVSGSDTSMLIDITGNKEDTHAAE